MITANEKLRTSGVSGRLPKYSSSSTLTTHADHEILLQSGARWQIRLIRGAKRSNLHEHGFVNECLVFSKRNMKKRDNKSFMQSPGNRYLVMSRVRQVLHRATTRLAPVSIGGSVPRYRTRKKGHCIGRKQESISELGAWTYISCNLRSTDFMFLRIINRRERRAHTWPGESKERKNGLLDEKGKMRCLTILCPCSPSCSHGANPV